MTEVAPAFELPDGLPPRHIDLETAQLDRLARSWLDVQGTRKALAQRELDDRIVASFAKAEQQLSRALTKTLRGHALWPWLSQFPGLGGAHTALIIGRIGDPRRFPGQRCSEGHYLPPLYAVGAPCPVAVAFPENEARAGDGASEARADERYSASDGPSVCPGFMVPPRETTGVRSLWHWAGLHALENGRAPRKTKGQRADWDPRARSSVMQPGGIAEQIVRLNVPHYAPLYREAKGRLILRVIDNSSENDLADGDANHLRAVGDQLASDPAAGRPSEPFVGNDRERGRAAGKADANDHWLGRPLRPFEADRIARKIAAKAFLGDMLTTWKAIA